MTLKIPSSAPTPLVDFLADFQVFLAVSNIKNHKKWKFVWRKQPPPQKKKNPTFSRFLELRSDCCPRSGVGHKMPEITWRCLTDRFLFKSTTPDCFPSKIKPTLVGFPVLHITSVCQLLLIFVNQGKPPFVVLNIFGKKNGRRGGPDELHKRGRVGGHHFMK